MPSTSMEVSPISSPGKGRGHGQDSVINIAVLVGADRNLIESNETTTVVNTKYTQAQAF